VDIRSNSSDYLEADSTCLPFKNSCNLCPLFCLLEWRYLLLSVRCGCFDWKMLSSAVLRYVSDLGGQGSNLNAAFRHFHAQFNVENKRHILLSCMCGSCNVDCWNIVSNSPLISRWRQDGFFFFLHWDSQTWKIFKKRTNRCL